MRVWVVEYDAYGDRYVVGVFTTRRKVMKAIKVDPSAHTIREFTLDVLGEV